MARMIMIGTFSEKGVRGLMINDLGREAIVKQLECNFVHLTKNKC